MARTRVCFPQTSFRSLSWVLGSDREADRNSDSDGGIHQSDLQFVEKEIQYILYCLATYVVVKIIVDRHSCKFNNDNGISM